MEIYERSGSTRNYLISVFFRSLPQQLKIMKKEESIRESAPLGLSVFGAPERVTTSSASIKQKVPTTS